MRNRFFNENRIDGMLQRSYLANVLRFYFERSRRYNLFDTEAEKSFMEQLARLEKTGLDFRPSYEGYIVNLEGAQHKPLLIDTQTEKAKIIVLTAKELEDTAEISPLLIRSTYVSETTSVPSEEGLNGSGVEDEQSADAVHSDDEAGVVS